MKYIQKIGNYETSINDILARCNKNSNFVSSWDKSDEILNFDEKIILKTINEREKQNAYIMSKDMEECKKLISNYISLKSISDRNITIVSNGTIAGSLVFMQLQNLNIKKVLVLGPIYFTYKNICKSLEIELYNIHINLFEKNESKNIQEISKEITEMEIGCILLINPLFGTGIALDLSKIKLISNLCDNLDIFFVIDNIYGNMNWGVKNELINRSLIEICISRKKNIVYDSIPKRVFLNGIKSACIYGAEEVINSINYDSENFVGGITYIQHNLLFNILNNEVVVQRFINDTLIYAQDNYNLIYTLLAGSNFKISATSCGYFSLIGIPYDVFSTKKDKDIAEIIFKKCNVIVIPHSRYFYNDSKYFSFRINLVLKKDVLLKSMIKLLEIYGY